MGLCKKRAVSGSADAFCPIAATAIPNTPMPSVPATAGTDAADAKFRIPLLATFLAVSFGVGFGLR